MKEQVSVDKNGKWPSLHCVSCNTVKIECEHIIREFERLKRLDENVKNMIDTLKEQSDSLNHTRSSMYASENKYDYAAKILESLYDDKQG